MIKEIFVENSLGLKMAVRLNIDKQRDKLVFLVHGLGARKEYPHMLVLEETFAKNGYNVVNFDACDSNNASEKSSDGITFSGHYRDLKDVIEWAKTQDFYSEPFALAGQSMGAVACVLYSAENTEKVDLLLTANFSWLDGKTEADLNKRKDIIAKQGYYEQVSKSTGKSFLIKQNYLDDLKKYNLENKIKNIKAKTYILSGTADSEYHQNNSKKLFELLTCPKEIYLLPNVPHDLANTPETKVTFENALQIIFEAQN